ncbi:MAG: cupin domain-containing protein [Candidatus Pacebacteria bacterium]|nr:cupin domain-containing protein [Candidatus Paceibacterota bacterium]
MKKYTKINIHDQKPETTHNGSVNLIRLIHNGETNANIATMNKAWLDKGQQFTPHKHPDSIEYFLITNGSGTMLIDDNWFEVKIGDFITIPVDSLHSLKNTSDTPLEFISLRGLINK